MKSIKTKNKHNKKVNVNQNSSTDNKPSTEISTIIETYNLTPIDFHLEAEFEEFCKNFIPEKEKELTGMHLDIENVNLYCSEVNVKVIEQINLAGNQLFDHVSLIRRIMRKIEGKNARFMNQKKTLEEEISQIDARLDVLNRISDSLEDRNRASGKKRVIED